MTFAIRDFKGCIDDIQVVDLDYSCLNYTWNQSPLEMNGMLKKIDRVLVNEAFLMEYANAYAIFQPYRISDHSYVVIKMPDLISSKPKMFRFIHYITDNEHFQKCFADGWSVPISGHTMYRVVKKLRLLKNSLRKLLLNKGNLHSYVMHLKDELERVQKQLDITPSSFDVREYEIKLLKEYNDALWDEERLLKQKSKVEWLRVGDDYSKYFHNAIKAKVNRARINAVMNSDGIFVEGGEVADVFVNHYKQFIVRNYGPNKTSDLNQSPNPQTINK
ncbi:uncharacterized protein [Rutidosis leptorrhynchoides]|uniref:uncharacterized protein n=1 Tax=Rutidosis leptorrhynchoides TaxID=125765 RepID=UPI003A9A56BD